jgi:hypothetical protein
MTYSWLISDAVLDEALSAAMNYLTYTGAAIHLSEIEELCAVIITIAYQRGERDCVKLSNCAINAVEKPIEDGHLGPYHLL